MKYFIEALAYTECIFILIVEQLDDWNRKYHPQNQAVAVFVSVTGAAVAQW